MPSAVSLNQSGSRNCSAPLIRCWCFNIHVDAYAAMSLALSQYRFSTPEIRSLMRRLLGRAPSGRTIKRPARSAGSRLKRGRPATTPRVHKRDLYDLIEAASGGFDTFSGSALHLFHQIQLQFGLTPRQYLKWLTQSVRRGKCVVRKCLFCGEPFPSTESGERHCSCCTVKRQSLLRKTEDFDFPFVERS